MSRPIIPPKPQPSEPCNGCGICCAEMTCRLARDFLGFRSAPCPALEFDDGRFWCGLVRRPHYYLGTFPEGDFLLQPSFAFLLGFGVGCDANDIESIKSLRAREHIALRTLGIG